MLITPRLLLVLLVWSSGALLSWAFPRTPEDLLKRFAEPRVHSAQHPLTDEDLAVVLDAIFFHPNPVSPDLLDQVRNLVASLGDESYRTREEASKALCALGPQIIPALQAAQPHPDPEIRVRLRTAIQSLEAYEFDLAQLDYQLIAERLDKVLATGLPDRHRTTLAREIVNRRERGSAHRQHHVLLVPLVHAVLASNDDEVIDTLRPALDGTDEQFVFGIDRAGQIRTGGTGEPQNPHGMGNIFLPNRTARCQRPELLPRPQERKKHSLPPH